MAINRFLNFERRLMKDKTIKDNYVSFINEYMSLGHMEEITSEIDVKPHFFLPHHHVIKETSATTKLRVVFDGSMKTTSGASLNDMQRVGPVLQSDLFSILIRFRQHNFVAIADIEKMYRQIWINPIEQKYQNSLETHCK